MEVPIDDLPEYEPDGPPCAPNPNSALNLGGFRWLGMDGQLLTIPAGYEDYIKSVVAYEDDPQSHAAEIFGYRGVDLNSRTLAYWEDAAARGGYVLADLLQ